MILFVVSAGFSVFLLMSCITSALPTDPMSTSSDFQGFKLLCEDSVLMFLWKGVRLFVENVGIFMLVNDCKFTEDVTYLTYQRLGEV